MTLDLDACTQTALSNGPLSRLTHDASTPGSGQDPPSPFCIGTVVVSTSFAPGCVAPTGEEELHRKVLPLEVPATSARHHIQSSPFGHTRSFGVPQK